jgi:hypothetical protein
LATLATRLKIARVPGAWHWLRRRDGLQQIFVVVGLFQLYELLRRFMAPDWPVAIAHAQRIENLERWGHFAWERGLQRAFLGLPQLVEAMNFFYFVGHFILTGVFFFWLYFRSRDGFRSFRNAFLAATAVALFVHWRFPTAPPRLVDDDITDTLRALSHIDIGSRNSSSFSNPVAAVPSLHAGWAVGVAIGVLRYAHSRVVKALAIVYPLAVILTIVVTGNHYIFDAVTGILVMAIGFLVSFGVLERRRGGGNGRNRAILAPATRGGAVR